MAIKRKIHPIKHNCGRIDAILLLIATTNSVLHTECIANLVFPSNRYISLAGFNQSPIRNNLILSAENMVFAYCCIVLYCVVTLANLLR